jgi:pimeloyl-ACP methyl ester carboxylesterase
VPRPRPPVVLIHGAANSALVWTFHWGLVLSRRALRTPLPAVIGWLERNTARS